jgi:hypothetical protein
VISWLQEASRSNSMSKAFSWPVTVFFSAPSVNSVLSKVLTFWFSLRLRVRV